MIYARILVPLEHSYADRAILAHVRPLARLCGASLVLMHVADGWAARHLKQLALAESEEIRADREYLEALCAGLAGEGFDAEALLGAGDPADEIVAAAERERCDLIAMATHGHGFLADVVYGSVADAVRHRSRVPVLLVRGERRARPREGVGGGWGRASATRQLAGARVGALRSLERLVARRVRPACPARVTAMPSGSLDARGVLGLVAHRYPFLLVDRVDVPAPGRRVVGYKRFTGGEWAALGGAGVPAGGVVLGTAPGPSGLLLVEALAQTSAALLADLVDGAAGVVGYFAALERVRLRTPPRAGDEVRLTVTLRAFRRGVAQLRGVADVEGHALAAARFTTVVRARSAAPHA